MKNLKKIKRVFISGKPFQVSWLKEIKATNDEKGGDLVGKTEMIKQGILLKSGMGNEFTLEALLHEVTHVMDEDATLGLNEGEVQRLSCVLCNFLLSNFNFEFKAEVWKG